MKVRSSKRTYVSIIGLVGVLAIAGFAQGVHFRGGETTGPNVIDNGLTLTSSGNLMGLGDGDVTITVTASGDPVTSCTSKEGAQEAGHNPAPVTTLGIVTIPSAHVTNGSLSFSVTTRKPVQPSLARAAGCASSNWTGAIEDVAFRNYTINVVQDGKTVLTQTYAAQ